MGAGYIYILSNPSMPNLVKIGFTYRRVEERLLELSGATGVPTPFTIEYYCLTADVEDVEKLVHSRFSSNRRPSREFFAVSLSEAVAFIDSVIRPVKPHRFSRVTTASSGRLYVCTRCGLTSYSKICSSCGTDWDSRDQSSFRFLVITCSHCGQKIRVPRERGTLRVTCPQCSNKFITAT
jgi:hypothetical protein